MRIPKSLRFRVIDLYLGLICVYPLTTMLIDGTIINKLMFATLFALHVYSFFAGRIKRRTVILLLWLVLQYLFVLYHTDFPVSNTNLLFYFPYFLMYTYFMCDNMDMVTKWLSERGKYLHGIVILWSVLVGVSIFIPGCYYIKEGGALYFGSWTSNIFRLGPSVMFFQILVIVLQVMHGLKFATAYMVIPMYCVLMGSSRTYLVVGALLFVISWYITCKKKLHFWCSVIPLGILFLVLIMNSSMGEKILYTLDEKNYGDFWFRVTSSRSALWEEDLTAWSQLPILNKLLGCDIDLTYEVSGKWGHNDFVEIICSFGVLGIVQYIGSMSRLLRKSFAGIEVPLIVSASIVMTWLFNAFFNMHYVYFCAMLSFPFAIMAISYKFRREYNEKSTIYHQY